MFTRDAIEAICTHAVGGYASSKALEVRLAWAFAHVLEERGPTLSLIGRTRLQRQFSREYYPLFIESAQKFGNITQRGETYYVTTSEKE